MKIENLRSLIRESINEYIKKINQEGDKAACTAKMAETEKAIAERKRLMAMEGLDEAYHDMLDKTKMKGIVEWQNKMLEILARKITDNNIDLNDYKFNFSK